MLQKIWGNNQCNHPNIEKERDNVGADAGDYVCTTCGKVGYGSDWPEKEREANRKAVVVSYAAILQAFMDNHGGRSADWYVGISHDAPERLKAHGVTLGKDFDFRTVPDDETAREIERFLLDFGLKGDQGGGLPDKPCCQVYVYRRTLNTNP